MAATEIQVGGQDVSEDSQEQVDSPRHGDLPRMVTDGGSLHAQPHSTEAHLASLRPVDCQNRVHPRYNFHGVAYHDGLLFAGVQKGRDARSFLVVWHCELGFVVKILPSSLDFTSIIQTLVVDPSTHRLFMIDRAFTVRYLDIPTVKSKFPSPEASSSSSSTSSQTAPLSSPRALSLLEIKIDIPHVVMQGSTESIHVETLFPLSARILTATPQRPEVSAFSLERQSYEALFEGHKKHAACIYSFKQELGGVSSRYVITGGRDRRLIMFDFGTQKKLRTFRGHHHSIFFASVIDGLIVSASQESLRISELRGKAVAVITFPHQVLLTAVASNDVHIFAGLSNGDVNVYNSRGDCLAVLRHGDGAQDAVLPGAPRTPRLKVSGIKSLAISPEKILYVLISCRYAIFLWDTSRIPSDPQSCVLFVHPPLEPIQEDSKKCSLQ